MQWEEKKTLTAPYLEMTYKHKLNHKIYVDINKSIIGNDP